MSDLAEIGLGVDTTEINTAKQALGSLADKWASMVNSIIREENRLEKAVKASSEAQNDALDRVMGAETQRNTNEWLRAQRRRIIMMEESARIAAKQAREEAKLNEELREQARLSQASINNQLGVGGPSAIAGGASFSAMEAEVERLATKYNQVYAASQMYERSLLELDRAHQLGVISTNQHAMAVDGLNNEFQQFQAGTANFSNRFATYDASLVRSMKSTNRFGMVAQQVGYQVGDFLVQVQSGQSALVAFGQQGTQLAGLLPGVMGAVVGIGLSASTALLGMWMRSREGADEASEGVKQLEQAIKDATTATENFRLQREMLALGVDSTEEAKIILGIRDAQVEYNDALLEYAKVSAEAAQNEFSLSAAGNLGRQSKELETLRKKLETLNETLEAYRREEAALAKAEQQQKNIFNQYRVYYNSRVASEKQIADAQAKSNEFLLKFLDNAMKAAEEAQKIRDELGESVLQAVKLGQTDMKKGIDAAAAAAAVLASRLNVSLSAARGMVALAAEQALKEGAFERSPGGQMLNKYGGRGTVVNEDPIFGGTGKSIYDKEGGGAGGGGGGGQSLQDQLEEELEQMRESVASRAEIQIQEYEDQQSKLREFLDNKIITLQEYNELEKLIAQEHADAMAEIDVYKYGSALDKTGKWFGDMAAATQSGGEKLLRISKVFGAAEALVNSYKAYTDVLADGDLPWWAKIPAAVGVLSAGLGMVNAIKGVSAGGGGGSIGGGRGSATVAQSSTPMAPQRVLIQGLDANALYSGEQLANLFDAFYDENDNRGKVFMVQR
jgi:hypothetical protein